MHNSRFLDAYEDGATSMDIVAKTRELKKRHRATLVMPDDLKSKVYRRRRREKKIRRRSSVRMEMVVIRTLVASMNCSF